MKPYQLNAAVMQVVGDVDIDMLQVVIFAGNVAEIKVRRADDSEWFQGIVHYDNPLRHPAI